MFNKTIVADDLVGIVGVENPLDPNYSIIDTANQASTSGYFVTEIPLAKVQYFKESQDYEAITDVEFNDLLRDVQKTAIVSVCNQIFTEEDFIDRNLFYTNANNNISPETLTDGFVGWRIDVTKEKNVAFEITRVILDFESNFGDITLQLYNTGSPTPIKSQVITISQQHQEVILNWVVDNSGNTYKGDYYLGYVKDGTTPIPFKREYQNANVITCIDRIGVRAIQFKGHTGATIFDLEDEEGLTENIGINPDLLVYNDYTDFIKSNRGLLGKAVQLDMAIKMMNTTLSSLRVNRSQRISDEIIVRMLQEINGSNVEGGKLVVISLRDQLLSEITRVRQEVRKLKKGYLGGPIMVATKP